MLDEIKEAFVETFTPKTETSENIADIVHNRPEGVVGQSVEIIGAAVAAMLGGVSERVEKVEKIASQTDTILSSEVVRAITPAEPEVPADSQKLATVYQMPKKMVTEPMGTVGEVRAHVDEIFKQPRAA